MKAALFQSDERCEAFKRELSKNRVEFTLLDFGNLEWLDFDFNDVDIVIYLFLIQIQLQSSSGVTGSV